MLQEVLGQGRKGRTGARDAEMDQRGGQPQGDVGESDSGSKGSIFTDRKHREGQGLFPRDHIPWNIHQPLPSPRGKHLNRGKSQGSAEGRSRRH